MSRSHAYRPARRVKLIGPRSEPAGSPRARWLSRRLIVPPRKWHRSETVLGDIAVRQQRTSRSQKIDMSSAARPTRPLVAAEPLRRSGPSAGSAEPDDHDLGRSRGGLTTKLHLAVEQEQKPMSMSIVITAGQRGDSPQFEIVLGRVRVPRLGPGRPRSRPRRVHADEAYASGKNRSYLRRRGIQCAIPDKADQARGRRKLGSRGGRPPKFEPEDYMARNAVECGINRLKTPRRGHEVRQTRGPLRGNRPGSGHQRVAVTSTAAATPSPRRPAADDPR